MYIYIYIYIYIFRKRNLYRNMGIHRVFDKLFDYNARRDIFVAQLLSHNWFFVTLWWFLPGSSVLYFSCDSAGKESTCNSGHLGLIPELGRPSREEKGYPLQYSGLEVSMDSICHGSLRARHDWATVPEFAQIHARWECDAI